MNYSYTGLLQVPTVFGTLSHLRAFLSAIPPALPSGRSYHLLTLSGPHLRGGAFLMTRISEVDVLFCYSLFLQPLYFFPHQTQPKSFAYLLAILLPTWHVSFSEGIDHVHLMT